MAHLEVRVLGLEAMPPHRGALASDPHLPLWWHKYTRFLKMHQPVGSNSASFPRPGPLGGHGGFLPW